VNLKAVFKVKFEAAKALEIKPNLAQSGLNLITYPL
jgi:hypothetical protein